jgi:hypothetical protein
MPRSILFVAGQTATVAYLAPLWRRWMQRRVHPAGWRVIVSPPAAYRCASERILDLPVEIIEDDSIEALEQALDGWAPSSIVMSASFAPVERSVIALARTRGLPVARIIDTWYGYRRRLLDVEGKLDLPDRLLVIDEPAAQQAVSEGIPGATIEIIGQPAWEKVMVLPPADRRDVLFVSQPIERFYGDSLGYTEKTVWRLFHETIQRHPDLVRRVYYSAHPDDDMAPPDAPGVTVVKSGLDTLVLVGSVVGMFSSLVTDALLAGRHVVSFQPGAVGQDMCALGRSGLVPRALTVDDLAACMRSERVPEVIQLRNALRNSLDRLEAFCLDFASEAAKVSSVDAGRG